MSPMSPMSPQSGSFDPWGWRPQQPSRLEQAVSLLRLSGADTLRFLHGQTSQAIEGAAPGSCLPTCVISPTARMRALAEVLVEPNGALLVITAGDGALVREALDRVLFPADRVKLGPLLPAVLVGAVPGASEAAPLQGQPDVAAGSWIALDDEAWLLGSAPGSAPEPGTRLLRLAPQPGLNAQPLPPWLAERPVLGPGEQERWRIQHGWPASPGELNDTTNPFELGLADRVSLSKGCYVGQETLAKLSTYDGVKQHLRRWHATWPGQQLQPGPLLQPGQQLLGPSGERAGVISSALCLEANLATGAKPEAKPETHWIGLALVRRSALDQPGLRAAGDGDGDSVSDGESPAAAAGAPWLELSLPG